MVKVAYLYSDFPQMAELALELRESIDWEPVLWLGWPHLEEPVTRIFPGVPWQRLDDAIFGLPVTNVSTAQPPARDRSFWLRMQPHLPRLMNQMNRFGPADYFLFDERESWARDLLRRWHELLQITSPEVAFFEESPSVPFSYAAYAVCRDMGIATVMLYPTKVAALSLLREEVEGPPLRIDEAYHRRLLQSPSIELPPAVREALDGVTGSPEFRHRRDMEMARREAQRGSNIAGQVAHSPSPHFDAHSGPAGTAGLSNLRLYATRGLKALNVLKWPLFMRNVFLRHDAKRTVIRAFVKLPGRRIDDTRCTLQELERHEITRTATKAALREDYLGRCVEPNFENDKFVYFPLHYRPERTSNPDGGVFYDQFLALAILSEALPRGWKLYVKEHGVQFASVMYGECGRTIAHYDEIGSLAGVQFIDPSVPSKDLVLGSQAVASITGTVCWEAAILGKPAMYFGYPWYQSCPGTTCVESANDIRQVLAKPGAHIATDDELTAWHLALQDAGFCFEFNAWQEDPDRFPADQQYKGLLEALSWWNANRLETANPDRPLPDPDSIEA